MNWLKSSDGYYTATSTCFGRHYAAFQSLERKLKKEKHSSIKSLIIGPGLEEGITEEDKQYVGTFQPFELAHTFIQSNIPEYSIDVIDINPDVLEELKKPHILNVRRISPDNHPREKNYFDSFFQEHTIKFNPYNRIIRIPQDVSSRFNLKLQNIITEDLPKEQYDVVVCTVLLSHYYREVTREERDPVPNTLKKIENSVKPGGYLIDTEKSLLDNYWECITLPNIYTINPSVHPEEAHLFRKK